MRRGQHLIVMDVDSTVIQDEVIDLLADEAGVDEIYRVGGAQAIAALAYGTETIRPVDKITGPGNACVAAAKSLVPQPIRKDAGQPTKLGVIYYGSTSPSMDEAMAKLAGQGVHLNVAQDPLGGLQTGDPNGVIETAAHGATTQWVSRSARDVVTEDGQCGRTRV